jgi:hypothetical protein
VLSAEVSVLNHARNFPGVPFGVAFGRAGEGGHPLAVEMFACNQKPWQEDQGAHNQKPDRFQHTSPSVG